QAAAGAMSVLVHRLVSGDTLAAAVLEAGKIPGPTAWAEVADDSQGYLATEALGLAVQVVQDHHTLEAALLAAARRGGDADTVASIAGQIAGARDGVDAIPTRWLAQLELREAIVEVALALHADRPPEIAPPRVDV